jgi:polar amino acid transport system substrate-binding protein
MNSQSVNTEMMERSKMRHLIFILITFYVTFSFSETEKIQLAADEWCPVTCSPENKAGRGILYDIVSEALKNSNYTIEYNFLSWARAAQMVEKNKMNGLIGVYDTDFPKLELTEPVIESKDCLYGLKTNTKLQKWTYTNLESLVGFKVGTINGYGYGDQIDQFKATEHGKLIFEDAVGDSAVRQNLKKLQNSRVDLILENQIVINYLKSQKITPDKMTDYHCMDKKKIYIAFNNMKENKKVIQIINQFLKTKTSSDIIEKIKNKYK